MKCSAAAIVLATALAGAQLLAAQGTPATQLSTRPATRAADADLPTAAQVLSRFLEVTGGREAHLRAKSLRQVGTIRLDGVEIEGDVTILAEAPDRLRIEVAMERVGTLVQGANGDLGWAVDPFNGARIMGAGERALLQRGLNPHDAMEPESGYESVRLVGEEQIETPDGEVNAYRIDFTLADGTTLSGWYDVDSGLRIKRAATHATEFGEQTETITYGDWREVGDAGLKLPFLARHQTMNGVVEVRLESVEVNPQLPPDAFEPPEAIRKELERRALSG